MPFDSRVTMRCLRAMSGREVDADVVGDDPELLAVLQVLVEVGGVQQRLRRDAAAQQAGAAGADGVALDDRGLEAHLGGADRGHVAAGAAADHGDVEISPLAKVSSCRAGAPREAARATGHATRRRT